MTRWSTWLTSAWKRCCSGAGASGAGGEGSVMVAPHLTFRAPASTHQLHSGGSLTVTGMLAATLPPALRVTTAEPGATPQMIQRKGLFGGTDATSSTSGFELTRVTGSVSVLVPQTSCLETLTVKAMAMPECKEPPSVENEESSGMGV